MTKLINDPHFKVTVLSQTPRPNLQAYLDLHQCYSEGNITDQLTKLEALSDEELGRRVVDNCVKYGHYGVLESNNITFAVEGFPHNVMVQARTHRISTTFNVQSMRYTGNRIVELAKSLADYDITNLRGNEDEFNCVEELVTELFYLRPIDVYCDREGHKLNYDLEKYEQDLIEVVYNIREYQYRIHNGYSHEHARDFLMQNFRQNFTVGFNARSLMHFLDMRSTADAQIEIRTLAYMLFEEFKNFMPEVAQWYEKNRLNKNRLAP